MPYVLRPLYDTTLAERQAAASQTVGPDGLPTGGPSPSQGLGIASLVLGILSIVIPYIGLILGIIAIVLSRRQRRIARTSMATAGLILGIIGTALSVLWAIPILIYVADLLWIKGLRSIAVLPS